VRRAEVLRISRGSVYYLPRSVSAIDLEVMRRLDRLHLEFPFAGSRMLRGLLAAEGCKIGRRHVKTLMRFAGTGLQRSLVAASPSILPSFAALVTSGPAKLVCLSIQHRVQRLLDCATNHLAEIVSDSGLINLDDLAHRLLVTHRLLLPYSRRSR
jgi:hypothetical protein